MVASSWVYRTAYQGDVRAALESLQREVFTDGDYYWAYEFYSDVLPPKPRPATVEELWEDANAREEMTHSILDVDTVIAPGEPEAPGTVRRLAPGEVRELFGVEEPTPEQFDRADRDSGVPEMAPRGSGVCMLLYADGEPAEVAFWGDSGD